MKDKKIRVLFEFPEKWVDLESPMGFLGDTLRNQLKRDLREYVTEKLIEQTELPKIEITPKEIKDRMLTIMAERALEEK